MTGPASTHPPGPGAPAAAPGPVRALVRADADGGALLGGVAAGLAAHLGRRRWPVRLVFAALTLAGGFGLVLYAAYWVVLPLDPTAPARRAQARRARALLAVVVGGAVLFFVGRGSGITAPALLAAAGGALVWRQATDARRRELRRGALGVVTAARADALGVVRLAAGGALVLAAVVLVVTRGGVGGARGIGAALSTVLVAVVGVALLTGPWWVRLVTELDAERRERIRSEERAELAARVHDSVLQTLAMVQRRADDPREVARLARGQERELRAPLWGDVAAGPGAVGPPGTPRPRGTSAGGLAAAARAAASEVEDTYGVAVELVTVGDAPPGPPVEALVAAAREALVNAAKHAGVGGVSLYVEGEGTTARAYVRDRGRGFDPADVPPDRQGLRRSVHDRLARHGGTATVRSAPGAGTEVELEVGW